MDENLEHPIDLDSAPQTLDWAIGQRVTITGAPGGLGSRIELVIVDIKAPRAGDDDQTYVISTKPIDPPRGISPIAHYMAFGRPAPSVPPAFGG